MLGFGRVKLRADADVLAWISPTAWHDPMGGVVGGDVGLDCWGGGVKNGVIPFGGFREAMF